MTESPQSSIPQDTDDSFTIAVRDVPELVAAFEYAEKHAPELPAWLPGAMNRVYHIADANGGIALTENLPYLNRDAFAPEPVFIVVYDGNPDHGAMQVSVTTPVLGHTAATAEGNDALLVLPAHQEAFVRLKRSQAEPEDLGRAYAAVEQWLQNQGFAIAAAPREIYYTDFLGASPNDEVCDIAWPITLLKA